MEAWCFRCGSQEKVIEPLEYFLLSNGRNRLAGTCATCNGKVSKFVKKCDVPEKIDDPKEKDLELIPEQNSSPQPPPSESDCAEALHSSPQLH